MAHLAAARYVGHKDVVMAARDLVRRGRQRQHRPRDATRQVPTEEARGDDAADQCETETLDERTQATRDLGLGRRDDQRAERPASRGKPQRLENSEVRSLEAGRAELERSLPSGAPVDGVLRKRPQPGDLVGKRVGADVEDLVPGRALELRRGEPQRLLAGVVRGDGLALVELRETVRFAAELRQQLLARVVLEQGEGNCRGDHPAHDDADQEEGRQPEAQRSVHGGYTVLLGADRVPSGPDLVAHAPHGHDGRRLAELAAQLPHVDVHGARVPGERVAPDALEQLVTREYETAVVEELPQQVELLRRELDLLVSDFPLATAGVDHEVAVAHDGALRFLSLRSSTAQDRLHARNELARVE